MATLEMDTTLHGDYEALQKLPKNSSPRKAQSIQEFATSPKIIFDGQGGIKLGPNANYVIVEGFEVEGPSQSITYAQAIMNRRNRITLKESLNQNNNNYSYFSGKGIWGGYDPHHHIIILSLIHI